jgi:hypothetical protein
VPKKRHRRFFGNLLGSPRREDMTDPAEPKPPAGAPARVVDRASASSVDEFAHIPRRRARHPAITVGGALLAFFLIFYSWRDVRYALSSSEPVDLGTASVLFGGGKGAAPAEMVNRYVRVAGVPDRESALELDTKGSWVFSQLFRVLGTGDRLFVHRLGDPLPAALAEADVFQGRLIRIDELPYADAIRAYFARHVTATHYFTADAAAKALAGRAPGQAAPLSIVDRGGDRVTLGSDETLAIDVVKADQVQLGLPKARFATEDAARAAIESRGGEVITARGLVQPPPPPSAGAANLLASAAAPPARWTFVVRFPAARRQAALDELGDIDRTVEIRDARETVAAHIADLGADAGGPTLVVHAPGAAERRLAVGDVATVHTVAPVMIPDGALMVIEGDRPRDHVASVVIALVLFIFGVFNIVALARNR